MTTELRLAKLESECRVYRRIAGVAVVALLLICGLGAVGGQGDVIDVVRARRIEVVNDENEVVIRLESVEGSGLLTLHDFKRRLYAMISHSKELKQSLIALASSKEKVAIQLITGEETDGGSLEVYNSREKPVAAVQCGAHNAGLVFVMDHNGVARKSLDGSGR